MTIFNEQTMLTRYQELCAKRDEVYKTTDVLQTKLSLANQEVENHRQRAMTIAAQIDKEWEKNDWFALKREIAFLAKQLGRPNGPLAS